MRGIIKENLLKNIILIVVLALLYSPTLAMFDSSGLENDKGSAGSIIVVVSIIIVTACFGAFAFTYEKINTKSVGEKILAHTTTGLLLFIIGFSLICTSVLTKYIMGNYFLMDVIFATLYVACVCYDFWDLLRAR